MSTYELCLLLILKSKLTAELLDVYFAAGRLTAEQYKELIDLLNSSLNSSLDSNNIS